MSHRLANYFPDPDSNQTYAVHDSGFCEVNELSLVSGPRPNSENCSQLLSNEDSMETENCERTNCTDFAPNQIEFLLPTPEKRQRYFH